MMTLDQFTQTLENSSPPEGLSVPLKALWHAGRDAWDTAHDLVQDDDSGDGAWVHAYLHRVEGDLSNAAYWYRRAGKPVAKGSLTEEWNAIVEALIRKLKV